MSPDSALFPSYSPAERWADMSIHIAGVAFAAIGGSIAVTLAFLEQSALVATATAIYVASLFATLLVSALYNLTPPSNMKRLLRRADHATIFTLIAGTATPFAGPETYWGLAIVWAIAIMAAITRLFSPRWSEPYFIPVYVLLGWLSGVVVVMGLAEASQATLILIVIGGVLYTTGVAFHMWHSLKFQNAIWHGFVLAASACHYAAILVGAVLTPQA